MGGKIGVLNAYCENKSQRQILLEYVESIPEGCEITYQTFSQLVENGIVKPENIRQNMAWLCYKKMIEKKHHGVYIRTRTPKKSRNSVEFKWVVRFYYEDYMDYVDEQPLLGKLFDTLCKHTPGVRSIEKVS